LFVPAVVALVVSGLFLWHVWSQAAPSPQPTPSQAAVVEPTLTTLGTVVDAGTGAPLPDAWVTEIGGGHPPYRAGEDGKFRLGLDRPTLVRASAPGYSARVLALAPGQQPRIDLVRRDADSLSLRFGGDVMLGRRFYEPTSTGETWLRRGGGVEQHLAPLRWITPLLADADLTVVNLETSLVANPYFSGARPSRFHPDKDLVFASAPATAVALKRAGVDVVDLGNNHVYDALSDGLASTVRTVEAAGLAHFGAGRTPEEAWQPAYVRSRGQRVAFIGCTTVTGSAHAVRYVTGPTQGGAAECATTPLRQAIRSARSQADVVVVMMHGGVEYQATQDRAVRAMTALAADEGATLVVNGHPHVVGGITQDQDTMVAETMGNLIFDQNLWSTLRSYLLRVDLQDGTPVRTQVDPFAITDYVPVPTTGLVADSSARSAAGLLTGPMLLGPGTATTTALGGAGVPPIEGKANQVATLPPGSWLAPGNADVTPGQDLLFGTGSFELMDTGSPTPEPLLWTLGKYTRISNEAACSGSRGLHAVRQPARDFDVVAYPAHRVPVTAGDRLTLTVEVARASTGAQAEIRWYPEMAGPSTDVDVLTLGPYSSKGGCRQYRLDVQVPYGVTAAQPYLRLGDPGQVTEAGELMVDNLRLVRWSSQGSGGRVFDTIRFRADATADLVVDGR
jgi:poly-gamma-glutamate synthesis protein (capsule biosynthesis protein)